MSWVQVAGAVVGGAASIYGANRAADAAEEGSDEGIREMRRQFDAGVEMTRTQRELQDQSATGLQSLLGLNGEDATAELRNRPGYQFAVGEAIRGQDTADASRGQLFSGAAGIERDRRLYGLADQNYNNEVNRLLAAANGGTAAQNTAAAGNTVGANIATLQQYNGQARASGILGASNQINSLINGAGRSYADWRASRPSTNMGTPGIGDEVNSGGGGGWRPGWGG